MELIYTALSVIAMLSMITAVGVCEKSSKHSGKQALEHIHTEQVLLIVTLTVEVSILYLAYVNNNTFGTVLWTVNIVLAMTNLHLSEKRKQKELSRID